MSCSSLDSVSTEDSGTTTASNDSQQLSPTYQPHHLNDDDDTLTVTPSECGRSNCCDLANQQDPQAIGQHLNPDMADLWTMFIEAQLASDRVRVSLQYWSRLVQLQMMRLSETIQEEKLNIRRAIDDEIDWCVDRGSVALDDVLRID